MARRKPYTKVQKSDQVRAEHVKGMGDVGHKGFQCLNAECTHFIFIPITALAGEFSFTCPECGFVFEEGGASKFYDYDLIRDKGNDEWESIEQGVFEVDHRPYIESSGDFKYCIVCNSMKRFEDFSNHGSRATGRQGECRQCKDTYNAIKNQTRIPDQHREAAQKRRLYVDLSGSEKIDSHEVFAKFSGKCFNCQTSLVDGEGNPLTGTYNLDHTLPAVFLWPLTTDNATLLCRDCNGGKSGKWPSEFYSEKQLKALATSAGVPLDVLRGAEHFNPDALAYLSDPDNVDQLIAKYASYMDELIRLRNRIILAGGHDFFKVSNTLSKKWIDEADEALTS